MTEPALALVHSPLVGPLTWQAVADGLRAAGQQAVVPDLTGVLAGPAPYHPAIARQVAGAADRLDQPVVLVGHSGAGPLLPGIAAAVRVPVRALLYVDAGLPHPGRSWFETAPAALADQLRGLAADGWLPPWHEWFPADTVAQLLPDPQLRARFTAELGPLPLAFFQEPASSHRWPGPSGYLLLSEAYREQAGRAAAHGVPVVERLSHHLGLLTSPATVTGALRELLPVTSAEEGQS